MIERMGIQGYVQLNGMSEYDARRSDAAPYLVKGKGSA